MRLFSNVWIENTALFERLMEIHSNSPKLYYGFKILTDPLNPALLNYSLYILKKVQAEQISRSDLCSKRTCVFGTISKRNNCSLCYFIIISSAFVSQESLCDKDLKLLVPGCLLISSLLSKWPGKVNIQSNPKSFVRQG